MLPLLDDLIHDPPGKVLPVDRALDNRFQSDSSPPQRRNPFPRVDAVETAEAILIPRQDDREVAPSSASRIICMNRGRLCVSAPLMPWSSYQRII